MACCTPGPKLVRPLWAVDGIVLLDSKPIQLGLDQFFLLMKSAVEFQLFLSVLAEFSGKKFAFRND